MFKRDTSANHDRVAVSAICKDQGLIFVGKQVETLSGWCDTSGFVLDSEDYTEQIRNNSVTFIAYGDLSIWRIGCWCM